MHVLTYTKHPWPIVDSCVLRKGMSTKGDKRNIIQQQINQQHQTRPFEGKRTDDAMHIEHSQCSGQLYDFGNNPHPSYEFKS